MTSLFGPALSALQGFFTRGFWFGSFLPVAIFCVLNELIGYVTIGGPFALLLGKVQTANWFWSIPIAAGMIVFAYALAPLVPVCRAVLDGRLLPDGLVEQLRAEPLIGKEKAELTLESARDSLAQIELLRNGLALALLQAAGDQAHNAQIPPTLTGAAVTAKRAVAVIESRLERKRSVTGADLSAMLGNVAEAIRQNALSADARLDLVNRCLDVLPDAADLEQDRVTRLADARAKWPDRVKATDVANARELSEIYSQRVYGVGFDYLWPRVQIVIPDKDPALDQIQSARAVLEFAVLSLILMVALLVIWLPVLAVKDTNPWGFLILGIGGPIALGFFYRIVVAAQTGLGELAQVIIDRFRFDLLKALHIKQPPTLAAEREVWALLADVAKQPMPQADLRWTASP